MPFWICLNFKEICTKMNMLLKSYPMWVTKSFPVIRIVLFCLVVVAAILLIVTTLLQNEDSGGTNAITGQQESYYAKNKGGSRDGKLKIITIVCACVIAVCVILYFVSFLILPIDAA